MDAPDEFIAFACSEGMTHATARRAFAAFVDYWLSVPGAKGRKLDWRATWRNWVRRDTDRAATTAPRIARRVRAASRSILGDATPDGGDR